MIATVHEVPESEAEGKVKSVYEDVKATLRTPTVSPMFRQLAVYPWYLELAWRNFKPNAAILYFERAADRLRAQAVDIVQGARGASNITVAGDADKEALRQTLAALHYVNPKLLLAAGALRAGANGQLPRLRNISSEDMRLVPPGIPAGLETLSVAAGQQTAGVAGQMDLMSRLAGDAGRDDAAVLSRFSAIGSAWSSLEQLATSPAFTNGARLLMRQARETVESLPYRMEISATAARQAGLQEHEIDAVKSLLNRFWNDYPALVLIGAALVSAVDGPDAARRSPFPLTP